MADLLFHGENSVLEPGSITGKTCDDEASIFADSVMPTETAKIRAAYWPTFRQRVYARGYSLPLGAHGGDELARGSRRSAPMLESGLLPRDRVAFYETNIFGMAI
jgi:hypothetical protein